MNINYSEIQSLTGMPENKMKKILAYYSKLESHERIKINEDKQEIFKNYKHLKKNKSLLDHACLIIAIKRFYNCNYNKLSNQIDIYGYGKSSNDYAKSIKISKKMNQLSYHRDFICQLATYTSYRIMAQIIKKKLKISVSHTYVKKFIDKIKKGEL